MKRYCVLFISFMLLAACSGNEAQHKTGNTDARIKVWAGTIRTDIPVLLWFTVDAKDSMLYGQVVYTNYPQPPMIMLIGNAKDGCRFAEYDTAGNITGYWDGKVKGDTLEGLWTSPKTGKKFIFTAGIKDTGLNADPVFAAGSDIDGVYKYAYPNEAGGTINVEKLDATHVIYNASCNTAGPAYNLALVDDDTLVFANNEAMRNDSSGDGKCSYTIHFYKNFLKIEYAEDGYDCGFGNAAGVNGIFIKTDRKPAMGMKIE